MDRPGLRWKRHTDELTHSHANTIRTDITYRLDISNQKKNHRIAIVIATEQVLYQYEWNAVGKGTQAYDRLPGTNLSGRVPSIASSHAQSNAAWATGAKNNRQVGGTI